MAEYLESLNARAKDKVLEALIETAFVNKIPIMQADALAFIEQLAIIAKAKTILEIGGAIGFFAISIAQATEARITSIEIDPQLALSAQANIKAAGLEDRITFILADALTYAPESLGTFDMILIDGAKTKYGAYFEKYAQLLNPQGFIISDNLLFRGQVEHPETIISRNRRQLITKIKRYNEFLKHRQGFSTRFYAIGDGMAVSIKTR